MRRFLISLAVVSSLGLAACGSSDSSSDTTAAGDAAKPEHRLRRAGTGV